VYMSSPRSEEEKNTKASLVELEAQLELSRLTQSLG
jgi:hypothetical protein